MFPSQVAFTKKVHSGNIKLFKICHPSGLPILPNLLRCKALEVLKVRLRALRPCIFGKLGDCIIRV